MILNDDPLIIISKTFVSTVDFIKQWRVQKTGQEVGERHLHMSAVMGVETRNMEQHLRTQIARKWKKYLETKQRNR